MSSGRSWKLVQRGGRPWVLSEDRRWSQENRRKTEASWRREFRDLARAADMPRISTDVEITVLPILRPGTSVGAAGACYPSAACAIDALLDIGVLERPEQVRRLHLCAPAIDDDGRMGMVLVVGEILEEPA